jgi:hypothetical protein
MLDRQRNGIPAPPPEVQQQLRPLSWHPNSTQAYNSANVFYPDQGLKTYYQPLDLYGTTSAHGLPTPGSYAVADEPQIQELITPLAELSAQEGFQDYNVLGGGVYSWKPVEAMEHPTYSMDTMFPLPQAQHMYQYNHHTSILDVPTAPPSPDFLPIQGGVEASPLTLNVHEQPQPESTREEEGEELVGMGLYDSPAEVQSSSLLFGGISGVAKKSLKLEESFEPEAGTGQDGQDEEFVEQSESYEVLNETVDQVEQFPTYAEPMVYPEQPNLAGQSFLFDPGQEISPMNGFPVGQYGPASYQPQYTGYGWI